jgi:hypothetical protein
VFDGHRALRPTEFGEQVDDGRAVVEPHRLAVGGNGDGQDFAAAASLAAAFFCAL